MELKEWLIIYKVQWHFFANIAVLSVLCVTALGLIISKDHKPIGDFILHNDFQPNMLHQISIIKDMYLTINHVFPSYPSPATNVIDRGFVNAVYPFLRVSPDG